jgi:hypothetical protein
MLLSILSSLLLLSSIDHVNAEPKVVSMKTKRMCTQNLQKRGTDQTTLFNAYNGYNYYVETTIGTPGQNVTFLVDTESDVTWMLGPDLQVDAGEGVHANCKSMNTHLVPPPD